MRAFAVLLLVTLLAGSSPAAEDYPLVGHGDRVTADVPAGHVAVLALDGLTGTRLKVKAVSRTTGWEPEIVLLDPWEEKVATVRGYRKAKLGTIELEATGRYFVLVRCATFTAGVVDVKITAKHPIRIRLDGQVSLPGGTSTATFPAFAGTVARIRVKGRSGFRPEVGPVETPLASELPLATEGTGHRLVRCDAITCSELGDERLTVGGLDGDVGSWKGKVELAHPARERRELEVEGIPEGDAPGPDETFPPTDDPIEPPDDTPGPTVEPPPDPWPTQVVVDNGIFRVTLEFVDPPPDPTRPKVRSMSQGVRLRARLENVSGSSQSLTWFAPPQVVITYKLDGVRIYSSWPHLDWNGTVSHAPGPILDKTVFYESGYFDAYGFPPGTYEISVGFPTWDSRVPTTAAIWCILE